MVIYDVDPDTSAHGVVKQSSTVTAPRAQWTTEGLTPSTDYEAAVTSYSDSCDENSRRAARKSFTTNATSSSEDPQKGGGRFEAKYIPNTPSGGRIVRVGNSTDIRVVWNRPPDADEHTCPHTDYEAELFRKNRLLETAEELTDRRYLFDSAYGQNLAKEYTAKIVSYSAECDEWSKELVITTTLP